MTSSLMDRLRTFLGITHEPPKNDFRNPIWGSDDDDDEDELYSRQQNIIIHNDPFEINREFSEHMYKMFQSFGSMFGDMKSFFHEDGTSEGQLNSFSITDNIPSEPENFESNSIRNHYLKPGYHNVKRDQIKEDIDLDGEITSHDISGLLKQKDEGHKSLMPFNGELVPGRSFCQTIITTRVTRSDGTVETRRIIKDGNEVIEETTTTAPPDPRMPIAQTSELPHGIISNHISEIMALFRNFN